MANLGGTPDTSHSLWEEREVIPTETVEEEVQTSWDWMFQPAPPTWSVHGRRWLQRHPELFDQHYTNPLPPYEEPLAVPAPADDVIACPRIEYGFSPGYPLEPSPPAVFDDGHSSSER